MSGALHFLPRFGPLSCVLCIASLAVSCVLRLFPLPDVFYTLRFSSYFLLCPMSGFHSRLGAIDLPVLFFFMVSLDKQLYIELAANQYRCLVSFV